eukprot:scaffold33595_cov50-Phaeocystis_antarctica.AAC.10
MAFAPNARWRGPKSSSAFRSRTVALNARPTLYGGRPKPCASKTSRRASVPLRPLTAPEAARLPHGYPPNPRGEPSPRRSRRRFHRF